MDIRFTNFRFEVAPEHAGAITEEDLPPRYNRRWTSAMKAKIVAAIESGLLTQREVERRYALSPDEVQIWQRGIVRAGTPEPVASRARLHRSLHQSDDGNLGGLIDLRL